MEIEDGLVPAPVVSLDLDECAIVEFAVGLLLGRKRLADEPAIKHTRDLPSALPAGIGQLMNWGPELRLGRSLGSHDAVCLSRVDFAD